MRSNHRWVICGLLFLATTINYVDRQILSYLKPILDRELGWTNEQFGTVHGAFFAAYAASLLIFGRIVDRIGVKAGYALAIALWSVAALAHAWVGSVAGFIWARVALGLGEGGNFPAAIKAIAGWFPRRERALATSVLNAGTNIGALAAPVVVGWLALRWGWQAAFVGAGAVGLLWLALWLPLYQAPERSRRVSAAELDHIRSDLPEVRPGAAWPLALVLRQRQAWAFIAAKLLTDPVWWFYMTWLPDYFAKSRALSLDRSWPHLVVIYGIVTVLGVCGGWLPGGLVRRGWSMVGARKASLLVCALAALPVALVPGVGDWQATLLLGAAAGAHQAWSANLFSSVSDMFPGRAVGSVIGLGGMAGAVAGIVAPKYAGRLLDAYQTAGDIAGGYARLFVACAGMYVVAFAVHHLLAPRFAPARGPAAV